MLKNRNILCLSNPNWEGNYAKTIVELMSVAAIENKVLYVDYQFTIKDFISTLLGKYNAPVKRMLGIQPRLRTLKTAAGHSVHVLTPPIILSINFLKEGWLYRKLLRMNASIVARSVQKALAQLKMENDLILIDAFNPAMGLPNIGKFKETLHIYHCYDEIGASVWAGDHGATLEKEYMPEVDMVITTSKGLFQAKKEYNKYTFLVPNGVNYALFHKGFSNTLPKTQKPIIGYIGTIDNRIDYDLMKVLFTQFPNYEFQFIGRVSSTEGEAFINSFSNAKTLKSRPANELPALLQSFSAGLIPFVKNEFTQGIYPLKINEYLAAGLPVVLTPFSDLSEFESIARIEADYEQFAQALEDVVSNDTLEKRLQRAEVAQANSWEGRWNSIGELILQHEKENALI